MTPTRHLLTGFPLGVAAALCFGTCTALWCAAVWSLIDGPTGGWGLPYVYAAYVVGAPLPLLWCVQAFSALQRARFRSALGMEIAPPPPVTGWWPMRLLREWRASATWRQLGYHLLSMVVGTFGVLAVVVPRTARRVGAADERAARALLGPSRAETLTRRVESLARSRDEVVAAADAERRRIERDLHDGAQQRLVSLAMNLGMARAALTDDVPEPARRAIEQAHEESLQALTELRDFVRGLNPPVLEDRGLDAALSGLAARSPVPVRLRVEAAERCAPSIEAIAYFVVSEALTNIARHSGASRAEIDAVRVGDRLRIAVTDDGRGGAALGGTGGLNGLAGRVAAADGTLDLHSPPGGPTTITVELPCA